MREIVYSETAKGVFEPAPTRAQKRQAKLAREKRAEKIDTAWGALGIALAVIVYAAAFILNVFADRIWPL